MMSWTITFILCIGCLNNLASLAQNTIGFRASAFLCGILLGTEAEVLHLQENSDDGKYISNIKKNYQLIVHHDAFRPC
jgi:hypothetical protein